MMAGARLGRYELLACLATGGMGEIFLARLEGAAGFEKLCVIKRILPHLADDSRFRSMLIREAQIAASMSHANLCHVYELDETHHQLYMVMEYLEGITLLQLLQATSAGGGQLELGLVAGIIQQASSGLHYAHELRDRSGAPLGLVHRDVTPSNLFLTEAGVVKLVDFGIAKGKDNSLTEAGAIKGKYAYLAPEHLRSEPIDRRVDVFSLGVVVYEMVTCRRLYQRETDYLTFRAVMEPPVIELRDLRPDAPPALDEVLVRALARDPAERFATVRQLSTAVIDALGVAPWPQSDISDMVRTQFAADLQQRNAEISKVIRRTAVGTAPQRAIPVIGRSTPDASDDYFSFETSPGEVHASAARFEHSGARSEAFGQAMRLGTQPAPPRSPSLASPPAPWRRNALPAMAILGGAATVLGFGLMLIGGRAAHRRVAQPAAAPVVAAAAAADTRAPRTARVRLPPRGPYGAALRDRAHELDQCTHDRTAALPASATAVIRIGSDGHATQVQLRPDEVNADRLGGCLRGVLQSVVFPTAAGDQELVLGLALVQDDAN